MSSLFWYEWLYCRCLKLGLQKQFTAEKAATLENSNYGFKVNTVFIGDLKIILRIFQIFLQFPINLRKKNH